MKYPDFDRAFGRTPEAINYSIMEAFERGEKAMKFRQKMIWVASAAAALVVVIAAAALASGIPELGKPKQDIVLGQQYSPAPGENPSVYYYTEKGNYFHAVPDCSGMQGAAAHDLGDALASGKGACPVCVEMEEILPYATPAATVAPTLMPERTADGPAAVFLTYPTAMPTPEPEAAVFCTENGTYYHAIHNCSGMRNAHSTFPEQAEAEGKVPCPVCLTADANAWFSANVTPEPVEMRYGLNAEYTPTPMPVAVDIGISADENAMDSDTFQELFGMEFSEAFPDYGLAAVESWLFDSGYMHWSFSNGENSFTIDENPAESDQDGMISITSLDDGAAVFRLMKNAPEPLRTIYMELSPSLIENTLAAIGKDSGQTRRLGDINLLYSYDMKVTNAEFTYYMNDGSIVHLGWASSGSAPELYLLQWEA